MTRTRILALGTTLALSLSACEGLREAMTAHVDVAAHAGSQELSVTHFADLLGNSQLPLQREVALDVANVWIDYQLVAHAAARGDSLGDTSAVDQAMWSQIAQARVGMFYETLSQRWATPPEPGEAQYNQGEWLAARHILFRVPAAATAEQRDSVRRAAESVRGQVTPANFAAMARRHGQDGSAEQGGYLGVFGRGAMVPEFEAAVAAMQPGQISPLVQTQFGYHIVQRSPYGEVAEDFANEYRQRYAQVAESTYLAQVEESGNVRVRANAPQLVRRIAQNPEQYRSDKAVIASSSAGDLTAARLVQWINSYPPDMQVRAQLQQAPDSMLPLFVRNVVRNELVLKQADSAGVQIAEEELSAMRSAFSSALMGLWGRLQIDPDSLRSTAATDEERERIAASRADTYLQQVVRQQAPYVPVPLPVQTVLREKYASRMNDTGIDRALERAEQIRVTAESERAAQQPQSQVPMPQGAPAPQGGTPQQGGPPPPPRP
ncbi:MAG TPA: peptidylprolyl isomerase [Gemmatimonadaceae bacterium]|nr:peptidylprolyl isomerase [Gemmatimonadaceae bacterium]